MAKKMKLKMINRSSRNDIKDLGVDMDKNILNINLSRYNDGYIY